MSSQRKLRVALVDDDVEFLDDTAAVLRAGGCETFACHRPHLAFRFLRRLEPDAVLLDLDMPGRSGFQVLMQLRASRRTAQLPVLLLTAHDTPAARVEGFETGLDDFVTKPFFGRELLFRLEAVVRRHRESVQRRSVIGADLFDARVSAQRWLLVEAVGFTRENADEGKDDASVRLFRLLMQRLRDLCPHADATAGPVYELRSGLAALPALHAEVPVDIGRVLDAANRKLVRLVPAGLLMQRSGGLVRAPLPRFRLLEISAETPATLPQLRVLEEMLLEEFAGTDATLRRAVL